MNIGPNFGTFEISKKFVCKKCNVNFDFYIRFITKNCFCFNSKFFQAIYDLAMSKISQGT